MISVIVPLAPSEDKWKALLPHLDSLPEGSEIILVIGIGEKLDTSSYENVRVVEGRKGRAGRMNCGADMARNELLWFLHADSQFEGDAIAQLVLVYTQEPDALYYFDLKFMDDGPKLVKLNEWLVRWRSDVLKMPFGDQGFAISKDLFLELGGYREDVGYGEDYLLTWKLKQEDYPIKPIGASIYSSARKYEKGGWGKVTLVHVFFTFKQGWPEFLKLLRKKFS